MECVPSLSCGAGWQGAFVWAAAEPLVRYLGALDCWVRAPGAVWERCSQSIARLQTNLSRRRVHAFLKSARAQAQSVLRWRDLARSECRLLNPGILCPSRCPISPIETAVACLRRRRSARYGMGMGHGRLFRVWRSRSASELQSRIAHLAKLGRTGFTENGCRTLTAFRTYMRG